jgi:hypothetical protein
MSAAVGGCLGLRRSRSSEASFYEREVYGVSAVSHRRFAWMSLAFVALFAASAWSAHLPAVPMLAVYTLALILYAATFVRGATGEDE